MGGGGGGGKAIGLKILLFDKSSFVEVCSFLLQGRKSSHPPCPSIKPAFLSQSSTVVFLRNTRSHLYLEISFLDATLSLGAHRAVYGFKWAAVLV